MVSEAGFVSDLHPMVMSKRRAKSVKSDCFIVDLNVYAKVKKIEQRARGIGRRAKGGEQVARGVERGAGSRAGCALQSLSIAKNSRSAIRLIAKNRRIVIHFSWLYPPSESFG